MPPIGGGLMQLVAYGAQDVYLTSNRPVETFQAINRRVSRSARLHSRYTKAKSLKLKPTKYYEEIDKKINDDCSICINELDNNVVKTKCNHFYHKDCINELINHGHDKCPYCRNELEYSN